MNKQSGLHPWTRSKPIPRCKVCGLKGLCPCYLPSKERPNPWLDQVSPPLSWGRGKLSRPEVNGSFA